MYVFYHPLFFPADDFAPSPSAHAYIYKKVLFTSFKNEDNILVLRETHTAGVHLLIVLGTKTCIFVSWHWRTIVLG